MINYLSFPFFFVRVIFHVLLDKEKQAYNRLNKFADVHWLRSM
jgi:hypothetical protein